MNRKRRKPPKREAPMWMVTYSDMITLILVFFILLFSMSQIDAVKFKAVAESYQERVIFDFMPSAIEMDQPTENQENQLDPEESDFQAMIPEENEEAMENEEKMDSTDEESLNELHEEVEQFLDQEELNGVISASRTDQGVVLVLQERVLFESGEAELIKEGFPFLEKVGVLLSNIPNNVKIEGHTDSRPINTYRFPSNWELSGARASSVVRFFVEDQELNPARFQASGYADTKPYVENNSSENMRLNRRVEITILRAENQ
ncbi:flagellar motor protein MotB [Allobacillus sp. SKP2-8]|uniref:flagellar motor protein MotS n=1 Tax=unclassified Allobacillus TaxID=2628859 RepID=UPI001183217E|nr:flagellar motor protein MotS [Allobacillus sp. SKP2-8]TSJ68456.1 flagellar motor protein MotB [Allobacillus sp. SKP2-8]